MKSQEYNASLKQEQARRKEQERLNAIRYFESKLSATDNDVERDKLTQTLARLRFEHEQEQFA